MKNKQWINEWQFGEVCGHGALQRRWCKGSNCNLTSISSGWVATITALTLRRRALLKSLFNLWECLGHNIYIDVYLCVCVCVCVKRLARLSPRHTVSSKTAVSPPRAHSLLWTSKTPLFFFKVMFAQSNCGSEPCEKNKLASEPLQISHILFLQTQPENSSIFGQVLNCCNWKVWNFLL